MFIQNIHLMPSFLELQITRSSLPLCQGKPINHPLGFEMKLQDPLDFYAVTDHAAWLGMLEAYSDPNSIPGKLDFAKDLHGLNNPENLNVNTTPRRSNIFGNLIANELVTPSKSF